MKKALRLAWKAINLILYISVTDLFILSTLYSVEHRDWFFAFLNGGLSLCFLMVLFDVVPPSLRS